MNTNKNMTANKINLKAELEKRNIEIVPHINGLNADSEVYTFEELVQRQKEGFTGAIVKFADDEILTEEFNKVLNNPDNAEKIMEFLNDESFLELKGPNDVICTFKCKRKGIAQCICLDKTFELEDFTVKLSRLDTTTGTVSKEQVVLTIQGVIPREVYKYLDSFDDSIHKSVLICTIADYIQTPDSYDFDGEMKLENITDDNYEKLDAKMQVAETAYNHYDKLEMIAEDESMNGEIKEYYGMLWISARRIAEIYRAQDKKYKDFCKTTTNRIFESQCINAIKYYHYKKDEGCITDDDMNRLAGLLFEITKYGQTCKDIWTLTGLLFREGVNEENVTEFIYPFFRHMRPILEESVFDETQCALYEPEDAFGTISVLLALLPIAPKIISREIIEFFNNTMMSTKFFILLVQVVFQDDYAYNLPELQALLQ